MISDEQGREWLLQKLYDDGWRYYLKAYNGCVYLTTKKPMFCENGKLMNPYNGGTTKCTCDFEIFITGMKNNELLDIAEELGIVDWSKVKVDTPIYVREHENNTWEKRHFAFFKNGRVYAWLSGTTSWTNNDSNATFSWKYAKLTEV